MNELRASGFGILGSLAMTGLFGLARVFRIPTNLEMVLVAFFTSPSPMAWIIGVVVHAAFGGLLGVAYVAIFRHVLHRGGAVSGLLIAVVHTAVSGTVLGLLPRFHPRIPTVIAAPGFFYANAGPLGALTFVLAHLVFGLVVGVGYGELAAHGPVHVRSRPA
jgi:hypothetical protein